MQFHVLFTLKIEIAEQGLVGNFFAMKKATIVSLVGYIILILVSVYGLNSYLNWFEFAEEGSLPASKGLLLFDVILGIVPDVCYAAFFVMVLRNKLMKSLGITGAGIAVFALLFSRFIWSKSIDYSQMMTWVYLVANLSIALLMLLYFCNLQKNTISLKWSTLGACASFVISLCLTTLVICTTISRNSELTYDLGVALELYLPHIINFVATAMASAFFVAMAKNIIKNGK